MSEENISGEVPVDADKFVREKLIWVLSHYNNISPAMLQVGIGTSMPPALWRPVFEKMKAEGLCEEVTSVDQGFSGRIQTITRYRINIDKLPKK
jgi:hypothetical protein